MTQQTYPTLVQCNRALTAARFWCEYKSRLSGWIMIQNLHTAHTLRIHFESMADDNSPYETIKPLHARRFQVSEGQQIWFSSAVTGHQIRIQQATYAPQLDEYWNDGEAVENLPYIAAGVAITTTYNFTDITTYPTIRKGHISHIYVAGEAGAFNGSIGVSDDGGVTYSGLATFDAGDPNKTIYTLHKILTHVRVVVAAGTFFIEAY